MSTIKTNNLQHTGSADVNLALDSSGYVAIQDGAAGTPALYFSGDSNTGIYSPGADSVAISTGGTARATVDSSGRFLVGTTNATDNARLGVKLGVVGTTSYPGISITGYLGTGGTFPIFDLTTSRGTTDGSYTKVESGDCLGRIHFRGSDGTQWGTCASIDAFVDGATGSGDLPGRLCFNVTADGASSPTERMRISSSGELFFNTTTVNPGFGNTATGIYFGAANYIHISRSDQTPFLVNRNTSDGTLVDFRQDGTQEGTISVSGTTVSYNGAHLSRWSQLPSGVEREEILRGTVLSNIDEMCEWGEEDNEQLNRMKVSDVEGDKNVSGVFQAWDDDDDTYTNDFYCAMTGDFIIRIGADVTVERGDLLMSAGDGTAKPQGDGFVQDKTIAKVTSTHVTCTYDDGSYCVPCVLMAC